MFNSFVLDSEGNLKAILSDPNLFFKKWKKEKIIEIKGEIEKSHAFEAKSHGFWTGILKLLQVQVDKYELCMQKI